MGKLKRHDKKFEPRLQLWKLKDEKIHEECIDMVRDRVEAKGWQHLGVNEGWQQMKNMTETAENMWKIKRIM